MAGKEFLVVGEGMDGGRSSISSGEQVIRWLSITECRGFGVVVVEDRRVFSGMTALNVLRVGYLTPGASESVE